jgi:RimJ/RimL family protein N-acetyltransferase
VALHEDGIELPTTVELQKELLEKASVYKDGGAIRFAMENLDGVMVGWATLHSRDPKNGTFGFGVAVYREYRGHGNAADAVRMLLKYGFWEQRYQKCNSACLDINEASIRLHEKLGFTEEGRIRRAAFFDGKYLDEVLFGMTREEFDERMKT